VQWGIENLPFQHALSWPHQGTPLVTQAYVLSLHVFRLEDSIERQYVTKPKTLNRLAGPNFSECPVRAHVFSQLLELGGRVYG